MIKRFTYWMILVTVGLLSCEDQITPELREAPDIMVVDAWLTNIPGPQTIRITQTQPYLDNSASTPVTGASITITSSDFELFTFQAQGDSAYVWTPIGSEVFGKVGSTYSLNIQVGTQFFTATSTMNRVPPIDSMSFRFEPEDFVLPDSYFAEFWSRDPVGLGDTYWIKSFKNGLFLNQPDELNIAFDAAFNEGGNVDGLIFIPPIRDAINPFFEEDQNGDFLSPFEDGDSVYVELHSITQEAFRFLQQVQIQTNRPGGFAELFAQPLANVPSNIINGGPDLEMEVLGFFNVAAVESNGKRLDISKVPMEQ